MRYIFILICFTSQIFLHANTIKINEVMPANGWTIDDEYGESSDWIELYNYGTEPVNIKNWRINDADNFENAFVLPDTTINPGEYLLIWASGRGISDNEVLEIQGSGLGSHLNADFYDQGSFNYIPISGNFNTTVRINNFKYSSDDAQAIFMLREENAANSRWSGVGIDRNSYGYRGRVMSKNPYESGIWMNYYRIDPLYAEMNFPNSYLKISRNGDEVRTYLSYDKFYWFNIAIDTLENLSNEVYLGMFIKTSNNDRYATLNISNFTKNENTIPYSQIKTIDYFTNLQTKRKILRAVHTNFKLDISEKIYLFNEKSDTVDKIEWQNIDADISCSKFNNNIVYYDNPTPSKENNLYKNKVNNEPKFSLESGYYNNKIDVTLSSDENADIYYTLDCTEPNSNSNLYKKPITISNTTIVKAICIKESNIDSKIITKTFIYDNPPKNLHSVFINLAEDDLYSKENGILYEIRDDNGNIIETNSLEKMTSTGSFELFKDGEVKVHKRVGIRLRGGATRLFPQKSFNISTGSKYNSNDINYKLFNSKNITDFKEVMLRNTGNDFNNAMIRDPLNSVLAYKADLDIDRQAYIPCRVYLNGYYYGILNLREKANEDYIKSNYDFDSEDINITCANFVPAHNSSEPYYNLISKLENSNTSIDTVFKKVFQDVDIESFIDFYIFDIIIGNVDWPHHNNKLWINTKNKSKWRHIMYDTDFSLGFEYFSYSYNPYDVILNNDLIGNDLYQKSMIPFMKFTQNIKYRNIFLTRMADLLNDKLNTKSCLKILDSLTNNISNEIPEHFKRWNDSDSSWKERIEYIEYFFKRRPEYIMNKTAETFHLPGICNTNISIYPENAASFEINSIKNLNNEFSGRYFADVPISVSIHPKPGWKLKEWSDSQYGEEVNIIINPVAGDLNLTAYLEPADPSENSLIINEIMHKPNDDYDSGDWIEIYNPSYYTLDISGWKIRDDDYDHVYEIPEGTTIDAKNYLVIARDLDDFKEIYPNVDNVTGEFDFGLSDDDMVRLFKPTNEPEDKVDYKTSLPWTSETVGTGKSLELLHYTRDNNKAENWYASYEFLGTPGRENSVSVSVFEEVNSDLSVYYDSQNNLINCRSNNIIFEKYTLYDLLGNQITQKLNTFKSKNINISAENINPGVYLLKANNLNNYNEYTKILIY